MKGKFVSFTLLLATILMFASCLNSNEDEVTFYNDTAITSFSLGTINQTVHATKKNSDEDSTYTTTFDGSAYSLYIDQRKGLIYNVDSLPCGADISKVVVTVGTKNSGIATIKNVDSDTVKYISSTDSLDFTTPRTLYVYAQSMQSRRQYTVTLNVHKEVGDTMIWHEKPACTELGTLQGMKALVAGKLFVVGKQGDKTAVYASTDAESWALASTLSNADAYKGCITNGSSLYAMVDGKLMKSEDGAAWTEVATVGNTITKLLGAARSSLYALGTDRKIKVSNDHGATWTDDKMEENADLSLVPDENVSMVTLPLKTNDNMYKVVLVGASTADNGTTEQVWTKIVDESNDGHSFEWTSLSQESNRYAAPRLAGFTAFAYDGGIAALGGSGEGGNTTTAFKQFYFSQDNGITWKSHKEMIFPKNFTTDCDPTSFAITADSANRIWIVSGTNGKVWCGRINRLGWARQEK